MTSAAGVIRVFVAFSYLLDFSGSFAGADIQVTDVQKRGPFVIHIAQLNVCTIVCPSMLHSNLSMIADGHSDCWG